MVIEVEFVAPVAIVVVVTGQGCDRRLPGSTAAGASRFDGAPRAALSAGPEKATRRPPAVLLMWASFHGRAIAVPGRDSRGRRSTPPTVRTITPSVERRNAREGWWGGPRDGPPSAPPPSLRCVRAARNRPRRPGSSVASRGVSDRIRSPRPQPAGGQVSGRGRLCRFAVGPDRLGGRRAAARERQRPQAVPGA